MRFAGQRPGKNQQSKIDVRLLRHFSCTYSAAAIADQCNIGRVTIDILPDDVLLVIFDFCGDKRSFIRSNADDWWQRLAHVCRNWRNIIFESPRGLDLQLVCTERTPVREMLDVWPLLPIIVHQIGDATLGLDNIVAALERNDRIREITLIPTNNSQYKSLLEAMQEPFPALTELNLYGDNAETALVIPDSFSGGSAPHLRFLTLNSLPFPGLSKLLLSATGLIYLDIRRIPHSGYISPEVMASCLSVLTRLVSLTLGFESPRSRPNRESRRLTRPVLPALIKLQVKGAIEYLEDLVARIDAPRLDCLEMKFFNQLIFDTPQLIQFINRTPELKGYNQAYPYFSSLDVGVKFPPKVARFDNGLKLAISCKQSEWRLSALAQVCSSSFPQSLIHKVERLYISEEGCYILKWLLDLEGSQWLELLHPFMGVKHLHLSGKVALCIVSSLQDLVGPRTTEVLPALESLHLNKRIFGSCKGAIGKFVAARQLSNFPVAVSFGDESNDKMEVRSFTF